MQPQHVVVAGLALLIAVASGIWFGGKPSDPVPVMIERDTSQLPVAPSGVLTVHVSGAVVQPGLFELPAGARVADALAAAGGALASADLAAVNLAAPVLDGSHIIILEEGEAEAPVVVQGDGRVRVNVASADELASLPGIGPVLAQRIADYRDANGPFSSAEDLLDVPGIGEGKLATMRDAVAIP
ncbi:MAG: helix-hairpin-helix domain-containing protein [Acidimicrobiia bacterium]|nr:helix-hairpin-helix domain-containing protein [Acidimicrobiia bacterium]